MSRPRRRGFRGALLGLLVFLFNGLLFILVCLHLRDILTDIHARSFGELLRAAAAVCATVIAVRFLYLMEERDQKLRLRLELLDAEQEAVVALRDNGVISDDALHQVQRDLDLEELMIEPYVNDSASNP